MVKIQYPQALESVQHDAQLALICIAPHQLSYCLLSQIAGTQT